MRQSGLDPTRSGITQSCLLLERATRAPHLALVLPRGLGARVGGLVDGLVDGPGLELGARGLGVPVLVPLPVQPVGLDLHVPLKDGRGPADKEPQATDFSWNTGVFIVALFNRRGMGEARGALETPPF